MHLSVRLFVLTVIEISGAVIPGDLTPDLIAADGHYADAQTLKSCWCRPNSPPSDTYQLAKFSPTHTLELKNFDRLFAALTTAEVADREVVIIGIVGKYRSGKSTLMNMLHRYLACKTNLALRSSNEIMDSLEPGNWLYENRLCNQSLFPTSNQQSTLTKGIWITAEPYLISNKAIFLLDTQGLSDNQPKGDTIDSGIFYITSLLSSTLIVNVQNSLDKFWTGAVNTFMLRLNHGLNASRQANDKIFPQLVYLVRDYHLENKTGEAYLKEFCSKEECRDVELSFTAVNAVLLPHIGRPKFAPGPRNLNEDFVDASRIFFDNYFAPDIIHGKKALGRPMTGTQLKDRFQEYRKLFHQGHFPTVESIYQREELLIAREYADKAFTKYTVKLREVIGGRILSDANLAETDTKVRKAILEEYSYVKSSFPKDQVYVEFCQIFGEKAQEHLRREQMFAELARAKQKADALSWTETFLAEIANIARFVGYVAAAVVSLLLVYTTLCCMCRMRSQRRVTSRSVTRQYSQML